MVVFDPQGLKMDKNITLRSDIGFQWVMAHFDSSVEEIQNMDRKKFFDGPLRVKSAKNGQKSNLAQVCADNLYVKKSVKICLSTPYCRLPLQPTAS